MRSTARLIVLVAAVSGGVAIAAATAQPAQSPPQSQTRNPWSHCCGVGPWPQGRGMMGPGAGMSGPRGRMPGPGGMMGSGGGMMGGGMMGPGQAGMARNRAAMMGGVPAPYTSLGNPLPKTRATVDRGGKVYAANCVSCHGETGQGDGPAGRGLTPPPGNLAWLSRMPMSNWDPFMYWTVAEGGAPVGTAMPAFKGSLSKQDTWAVIAYIQARLPPRKAG